MSHTESELLLLAEINQLQKKLARQGRNDLRDFARAAMQGLCANPAVYETVAEFSLDGAALTVARAARRIALATLAELEVKTP